MVQIVLSLEREIEQELREIAQRLYQGKKGALSKVVEQALRLLHRELERKQAYAKLLHEAEHAQKLGIGKFKREELYA